MNNGDIVFYILDVVMFLMIGRWLMNSRSIVVKTRIGARWIIPALFVLVAVIGVFRYEGIFRIIQTAVLLILAVMYYNIRSGLSEKGVVMTGALTKWEQAGTITLNKRESCILFKLRGRTASLYFDPEELKEVRSFLAAHAVKHKDF